MHAAPPADPPAPRRGPLALSESRLLRLFSFCLLYFAQGVPWGFISVGYVVLMADLGLDNTQAGVAIGLAYLPWSFKILWGPLLDAVPRWRIGRRRPFIVVAELVMGITLVAMMFADPVTQLGLVAALLFVHNTAASLQDVATDGMAVDLLLPDERGTANSLMWAGKSLGVVFGGGGGTVIAQRYGWNTLFLLMAGIMWAIMLVPLLLRERPVQPDDRPIGRDSLKLAWFLGPFALVGMAMWALSTLGDQLADQPIGVLIPVIQPFVAVAGALVGWRIVDPPGFAKLRASFDFRAPWLGLLVAVATPVGYALVATASTRMLRVELHLTGDEIAWLSGVVDPVAGVAGALVGGVLADRVGAKRAIALTMAGMALCLAAWAGLPDLWPSWWFVVAWIGLFNGFINAYSAASLGMFMTLSNPAIGATQFSVYMAAVNLTYSWTSPAGGAIADGWGYPALFAVAAVVQLVTIGVLPLLHPADAEARYRSRAEPAL